MTEPEVASIQRELLDIWTKQYARIGYGPKVWVLPVDRFVSLLKELTDQRRPIEYVPRVTEKGGIRQANRLRMAAPHGMVELIAGRSCTFCGLPHEVAQRCENCGAPWGSE